MLGVVSRIRHLGALYDSAIARPDEMENGGEFRWGCRKAQGEAHQAMSSDSCERLYITDVWYEYTTWSSQAIRLKCQSIFYKGSQ